MAQSPWASLPEDGDLYLYAEVPQARGLLEPLAADLGGKAGRAAALLDRAEQAYLCLYLPGGAPAAALPEAPPAVIPEALPEAPPEAIPEAPPEAQPAAELALTGRWSPDLLSAILDSNSGWQRHEPARPFSPYWSARRSPLEVGSPARGLLLAAWGRPGALERMMSRRLSPRDGPVEAARAGNPRIDGFLSGAALYAFAHRGGREAAPGGLPLRELWLAARRQGGGYELDALAVLAGAQDPPSERALSALARLVLAAWLRKEGIPEVAARLRAVRIEVDADGLSARGLRLSEAELLALLRGGPPAPAEDGNARRGD